MEPCIVGKGSVSWMENNTDFSPNKQKQSVSLLNFDLLPAANHSMRRQKQLWVQLYQYRLSHQFYKASLTYVTPEWAKARIQKVFVLGLIHSKFLAWPSAVKCCGSRNAATGWLSANRLEPLLLTEGFKASSKLKSTQTCLLEHYERHSRQANTFTQITG